MKKMLLSNIEWSKGFRWMPAELVVEIDASLVGEDAYIAAREAAEDRFTGLSMDMEDDTPCPEVNWADMASLEDAIDLADHALARALKMELCDDVIAELESEVNRLMQYQYE